MRLFFAIEFNEELKEYLFSIQKEIRQYCIGGNFASKDNFHLTLRFIGEQSHHQAELLISAMKATAASLESSSEKIVPKCCLYEKERHEDNSVGAYTSGFELRLNKIGKFDRGNKKILWIGLQRNQELQALYNKLEINLLKNGYNKEDRGFNPHITLAREVRIEGFDQLANKLKLNDTAIMVNAFSLMESKRIDNKLCYVPLERVRF